MSRLYFVHRIDDNVGDILAGPYRYWTWEPHTIVDICDAAAVEAIEPGARVVLGGGGLLMPWFDEHRARLFDRRPAKVAWWGVGERRIQDVTTGYLPADAIGDGVAAEEFAPTHLVGLRSLAPGLPHVPCPSCMFIQAFVAAQGCPAGEGVAIFEHVAVPLCRQLPHRRLINAGCRPDEAVAFIADCRVLVTNSYHGMYWGCLLGKHVICVPFSSGLYRHPWAVTYARPEEVAARIDAHIEARIAAPVADATMTAATPTALDALATAVAANEAYRRRVLDYLGSG
jgi:hypothetical protein